MGYYIPPREKVGGHVPRVRTKLRPWLRLYDDFNNRSVMAKEKNAARKANRCEVSKTFRFHSTVAFQQPGAQLQRHEHCAGPGQGVAQHFQVGLPSQHSPGMPDVGNDV